MSDLEKRLGKILKPETPAKSEKSSDDKEILMFESLPIIHNSVKDYIILLENNLLLKKNNPEKLPDGSKIYWLPSIRIGLTGEIGSRFLDYFHLDTDHQLKKLIKRFTECTEKIPEQFMSLEFRRLYFFACLTGRYCFSLKDKTLVSESDLSDSCEKHQFVIFSSSTSQSLRTYYNWVLYPLFLNIVPEKLRKKFWKDPSNVAKLIYQCKEPKDYLPLERLKTMKNIAEYKVNEKTRFCTKEYSEFTLNFISEIVIHTITETNLDLSDILEPKTKAEKIMKLRQEIENYADNSSNDITFETLDMLLIKIKEYESISKKNLRIPIKPEERKKLFPDKCFVCKIEVNIHNGTAGHVDAASHSGSSDLFNLLPLCSSCNSKMGNINLYEYLYVTGEAEHWLKIPLVNFLLFQRYDKEKNFLIESLKLINFQKKDCIDILNNRHLPIRIRFKVIDILFQLLKLILGHAVKSADKIH